MAVRNIVTALDIGTSTVQAVIAERPRGDEPMRILGVGVVPSAGVRRGAVVDIEQVTGAIRAVFDEAKKTAGIPVRDVWLAVGGSHISVSSSRGVVAVSRADGEISPEDVSRAIAAAETFVAKNPNKELMHIIPRDFKVDQEAGVKDPVGMHGVRLEVDTLVIECSRPFLKNMYKCVEGAGYHVTDYVFAPLAAAETVLTKRQKELGVLLLDIGGATASFAVYEEGAPIHAGVIPIGGTHITSDVAIGFQTHVDIAERVKLVHGSCLPAEVGKKEQIRLTDFTENQNGMYARKHLAEIIEARLADVFELVQKELKKVDRIQLLPAGVVIVGGSSAIPGLVQLARRETRLPVEVGMPQTFGPLDQEVAPSLAVVLGVAQWVHSRSAAPQSFVRWHARRAGESKFMKWIRSLLP